MWRELASLALLATLAPPPLALGAPSPLFGAVRATIVSEEELAELRAAAAAGGGGARAGGARGGGGGLGGWLAELRAQPRRLEETQARCDELEAAVHALELRVEDADDLIIASASAALHGRHVLVRAARECELEAAQRAVSCLLRTL